MPKISNDDLQTYFASNGSKYPLFTESVKLYNSLRTHADGIFPDKMIMLRRPSETEEILKYRKDTYKAITKLPVSKVITSLSKIRRSPDWLIDYNAADIPARIISEETLEEYCSKNIPGFGSITDWAFSILLKQNCVDANAVIAVIPIDNLIENEYAKPVPIIFNSDHIVEFNEKTQIAILKSNVTIDFALDSSAAVYSTEKAYRYYYIDDREVIIYEQSKDGYTPIFQQTHTLGKMPVFKVRGEVFQHVDNKILNRSRLDAMIPFLDEAACEYSDYKGSKIQHLYPLFWYYQNKDCKVCNGTGKIPGGTTPKVCTSCDNGKVKFSPFAQLQVEPPAIGNQPNPVPPAGFVARDVAILELQEKSVEKNNYKALAAINMQFLDQTPLTISGEAKNVDREELNNFVYNFAEDIIASIDKTIYFINEWRYFFVVPDKDARATMLPRIPVPQNFDLLPAGYLIEELTKARANKSNPFLVGKLEQEIAEKKFYNNPEIAETIKLFFDLDPLSGWSVDDKMTLIANKAITQEDFIISSYMAQFIKRAQQEDPKFALRKYDEQMKLLKKYAAEKIKANDQAQQMIDEQKQKVIDELAAAQGANPNPANPNPDPAKPPVKK